MQNQSKDDFPSDTKKNPKDYMLVICSSPVAYTLSLYVYMHEAFIILSCYLNCGLT